jgi:hypothetical protein
MNRRRRADYSAGSLTSLLDVLFIVTFATLVGRQARPPAAAPAQPAPAPPVRSRPAPADAGAATSPQDPLQAARVLHRTAVDRLTDQLGRLSPVYVQVGADGHIQGLERPAGAALERLPVTIPLLGRVSDDAVRIHYLGDASPAQRICQLVRDQLGGLAGHLVIIVPARPLAELTVALAGGLRRDEARCLGDTGVHAVLIEKGVP